MEVEIVLEIIHVADDDDVNALMEVEHQAPVAGAQADDDVEFLAELPRQPPVRAPQPNPANVDDDAIVMDAASYDQVSCASVRSSVSVEDSSEAGSSAADSGCGESINVPHAAARPRHPTQWSTEESRSIGYQHRPTSSPRCAVWNSSSRRRSRCRRKRSNGESAAYTSTGCCC
ncbi:hypothetical protein TKK_0016536 [Trichogramma kaykai]